MQFKKEKHIIDTVKLSVRCLFNIYAESRFSTMGESSEMIGLWV